MGPLPSPERPPLGPSLGLLVLVLMGILAAGLHPQGLSLRNDVHEDPAGMRFGEYGLAFTHPFLTSDESRRLSTTGYAFHVAFELPDPTADGFNAILMVHNGDDRSQLLIGQWRRHLIVMNGDDYNHRRRTPRLSVDTSRMDTGPLFLTLTVQGQGQAASLYLNGSLQQSRQGIDLTLPAGDNPARLVLGNSVYADSSFRGRLLSVVLFDEALDGEEIQQHDARWRAGLAWPPLTPKKPVLCYRFGGPFGRAMENDSDQQVRLEVPVYTTAVERRWLAPLGADFEIRPGVAFDIVANLLGFVPFGLLASAVVRRAGRFGPAATVALVTLVGGLLSLGIETAQAWMPSRSTTLIDLLLNTAGATVGSALVLLARPWRNQVRGS